MTAEPYFEVDVVPYCQEGGCVDFPSRMACVDQRERMTSLTRDGFVWHECLLRCVNGHEVWVPAKKFDLS